jgi:hypothetical protein
VKSRSAGVPLAVAAAAVLFLLGGALVALPAALTLLDSRGEGDTLMPLLLGIGVGATFAAVGIGIVGGHRWARIAGVTGATLAVLAGFAGLLFTTLMSLGMGIAFSDRLFLEPSLFLVLVIVLAIYCLAVLARHGAWFRPARTPVDHARSTADGE